MNVVFIYALIDPRTRLVRYVGQTRNGVQRAFHHHQPSVLKKLKSSHKTRWIQTLPPGPTVLHYYDVCVLEHSTVEELDEKERWWIAYGRASGWPLTNYGAGGQSEAFWLSRAAARQSLKAYGERQRLEDMIAWRVARGMSKSRAWRRAERVPKPKKLHINPGL